MALKKTTDYICPICGEEENISSGYDLASIDATVDSEGNAREFITRNCRCARCGHMWREYMLLIYDGYLSDGTEYTAEGEEA